MADLPGCRYEALSASIAFFDGVTTEEPLEPCPDPADFEAIVIRGTPGHLAELSTNLCAGHDGLAHLAVGYQRSIKKRRT